MSLSSGAREKLYDAEVAKASNRPRIRIKDLICAAVNCSRSAHCWAGALPACSVHEQRYRTYGSFDLPRKEQLSVCTAAGCAKPPHSKYGTLCRMHYFRMRRGSKLALTPRTSKCAHCAGPIVGNGSRFCSKRCCTREHQNTAPTRNCVVCKSAFDFHGTANTCSKQCAKSLIRRHKQLRRALEVDSTRPREIFCDREIFIRDKFICQICFKPANPFVCHPIPDAATLDHRVPLSRGGLHTRANVQTAHALCNMRKRDKFMHELKFVESA